jgi:hypothetical protein
LVYAAFKKYDPKIAGKTFISAMGSDQWFGDKEMEQVSLNELAHHQLAKAHGYQFIFPFLSKRMRILSPRIPADLKKNKRLLREILEDEQIAFTVAGNGKREIQVPIEVRRLLVRIYGDGQGRKMDDQSLRQLVERLWLKKSGNRSLAR